MSSYKITQFSAANIAGNCKLVDNKLKNSSGNDITFPSSAGTLALKSDIPSGTTVNATLYLKGDGYIHFRGYTLGSGTNQVKIINVKLHMDKAFAKQNYSSTLSDLSGWDVSTRISLAAGDLFGTQVVFSVSNGTWSLTSYNQTTNFLNYEGDSTVMTVGSSAVESNSS